MTGDEDALVHAVLASGVVLPAPAPGFQRFQAAALDDGAGPRQMAAAVSDDPALTGALLRVAGSPVFRPRSAPRSVFDAIALLGRTRSLATVASFWACRASSCKTLADLTYLAALLQDVGVAVALRRTPDLAGHLHAAGPALEAGIHRIDAASGTAHAAAGYLVARNWKLPAPVCEALRLHHDLRATLRADVEPRRLALLLAAGRRIRDGADAGDWAEWADPVADALGLDDAALEALAAGLD